MCVIILRPAGAVIPEENLRACWSRNHDGWGLMYAEDGQVHVKKSLVNEDFLDYYRSLDGKQVAIHFRLKTLGKIDEVNCHPFPVLTKEEHGQDLWLMHNGSLNELPTVDSAMSDSWHFATMFLRPILLGNPDALRNDYLIRVLDKWTGWSKFLLMNGNGETFIINKSSGAELFGGCWFSNEYSHKPMFQQVDTSPWVEGGAPAGRDARFRGYWQNGSRAQPGDDEHFALYGRLGLPGESEYASQRRLRSQMAEASRQEDATGRTSPGTSASANRGGVVRLPSGQPVIVAPSAASGSGGSATTATTKVKPRVRVKAEAQAADVVIPAQTIIEQLIKDRRLSEMRVYHLLPCMNDEIHRLVYDAPDFITAVIVNEMKREIDVFPLSIFSVLMGEANPDKIKSLVREFVRAYPWKVKQWILLKLAEVTAADRRAAGLVSEEEAVLT